jgi:putative oxidoreductase
MFANLLKPNVDLAALLLRLGLAAIYIVHGYIKVVQELPLMKEVMSLQTQAIVGWTELLCGIALTLGLFSRLAALATIPVQVGAIVLVTGKRALQTPSFESGAVDFMRVGPEYNLLLIVMSIALITLGSGMMSLDHCLLNLWRRKKAPAAAPQTVAAAV